MIRNKNFKNKFHFFRSTDEYAGVISVRTSLMMELVNHRRYQQDRARTDSNMELLEITILLLSISQFSQEPTYVCRV